jgi:hypothetical protein
MYLLDDRDRTVKLASGNYLESLQMSALSAQ